ncbi:Delta(3,5)-Delta(2,4)-dienoyl-CoA isomerase [Magnaporthiopsis poae ATCC 64411]|uniref:Delta(3,5)-Delta(2,4)-dienoyl-CoA isomerase n=1 Tax=Magnaporthiopsis poae (strain ATCC 64411 / 73-15) TaxID=644358 RepID=A0A0C4E075_MAGP6|nr:Delta(3,5)-Delta(2,4)-dienoyl-CoA isomerase [Magnaporthiopsis poae ATCC 64411]
MEAYSEFTHFTVVSPSPFVAHVEINQPDKLNSFHEAMWLQLGALFRRLSSDPDCEKPVICVLHGVCYGLAIDIASCADVRVCARGARLAVKEVDIGIAADIGTLSRLPRVVGSFSWVKDVCMTAREFGPEEAAAVGFVSPGQHQHATKADAVAAALAIATLIAGKSPVAVLGTKELLNHARDHTVDDSLKYTQVWNAAATQTNDAKTALLSGMQKRKPTFEKL